MPEPSLGSKAKSLAVPLTPGKTAEKQAVLETPLKSTTLKAKSPRREARDSFDSELNRAPPLRSKLAAQPQVIEEKVYVDDAKARSEMKQMVKEMADRQMKSLEAMMQQMRAKQTERQTELQNMIEVKY